MNIKHTLGVVALTILALSTLIHSCKLNEDIVDVQNPEASNKSTIMVFSGASLTDVLKEIIDSFEVNYPVKVQTNVASSGTLARQISQGEIPDLYLSANKKWMNHVDSLGFLKSEFNTVVAQNNLVIIAPVKSDIKQFEINKNTNLASFLNQGRLSIGDPLHVPAGAYAKQSLEHYGWFGQIQRNLLTAKDVRSALMMVELEETPLGIVYKTDALKSRKVKIVSTFPGKSHQNIEYSIGICNTNQPTIDFYVFMNSDKTKAIWHKHGFIK